MGDFDQKLTGPLQRALALTCILLLLAACSSASDGGQGADADPTRNTDADDGTDGDNQNGSPEAIPIGLITDLSGGTSEIGVQLRAAAEFAVDRINSEGGVQLSDGGAELELHVEDSGGVTENAVSAFTRLVEENEIVAVAGALTTPPTVAVAQEAQRVGIPLVTDTAAGDDLVTSGLTHVYRISQGAGQEGEAQIASLDLLGDHLGKTMDTVGFLGWDGTTFVEDQLTGVEAAVEEADVEISEIVRFTEGQPSYSSEIGRLRATDPDAIIWCVLGIPEATQIAREYRDQGMDPLEVPLINCSTSVSDPSFAESAGEAANGLYTVQGWSPLLDGVDSDLWEDFEEETGEGAYDLVAQEVQAIYTLKAAMESCDCVDSDGVHSSLADVVIEADSENYVMQPGDGIEFDEDGVNTRVLVGIYQWQDGELLAVWPERIAQTEPLVAGN